jgi:hypothetical protein
MGKDKLRRSRSLKDLMSKRIFGNDIPDLPLDRSTSLGRRKIRETSQSGMFHDLESGSLPTLNDQRAKERAFQRQASVIKRKLVPKSETPLSTSYPQSLSTRGEPTSMKENDLHSRSYSISTGHSRMVSEMSVPLIIDFDLAKHQQSTLFPSNTNFEFKVEPLTQRNLSPSEKQTIKNNVSPMHIINLQRTPSKSKPGPLKRLFSLRKSSPHSKSISQTQVSRSIYVRPPLSPPPSPRRDGPPRLTVQIPDSTMDRASKIFQNIYAAHAHAQENIIWGVNSPPSTSPPRTIVDDPGQLSISPTYQSVSKSEYSQTSSSGVAYEKPHERQISRIFVTEKTNGGTLRARVVPRNNPLEVDLSDYSEDEEWDESSVFEYRRVPGSLKEPVWEMLTPPRKVSP